MKTSSFNPFFFYGLAVFLLMAGVIYFVIFPLQKKIQLESDEIQKVLAKNENTKRRIAELPRLKNEYQRIIEGESTIRLLLSEGRIVDFIREIESLAAENNGSVRITQGAAGDAAQKKPASPADKKTAADTAAPPKKNLGETLSWEKTMRLSVKFTGAYPDAINFLHKIETLPYRLDVWSIAFRPVPKDQDKNKISSDIFTSSSSGGEEGSGGSPPSLQAEPEPHLIDGTFEIVIYLE